MQWHDIVAWVLQAVGMTSAAWGLYSSDTTQLDPATGRKRLTVRGRIALLAIFAGAIGLAVNQWRDHQRSIEGVTSQRAAEDRATRAERTLMEVRLDQQTQNADFKQQRDLLSQQLNFLQHLSLVQQQIEGVEISFASSPASQHFVTASVRQAVGGRETNESWKPVGNDVYFENCLLHGEELEAVRRPNYTWRISCRLGRPQGFLSTTFELLLNDKRAGIFDAFVDALLSPYFAIQASSGDTIAVLSTGLRPSRLSRRSGQYSFVFGQTGTRFSSLKDSEVTFRMDFTDLRLAPSEVRVRSLDTLAAFDQKMSLRWRVE